ncbi:MAG: carbohydrate ABC transporter permease [Clostridia bacterium]|jgi:ABC transporter, permease protein|nr:carbohydrate ABC transporter permease [Clostridia bacterium]
MIKNKSSIAKQGALYVVLTVLLLLAFVPIFLMISVSLKSTYQLNTDFWGLPNPVFWENYAVAFSGIYINMLNSFVYVALAVLLLVFLAAMGGYVFAVLDFPGKNALFFLLMSMMMIPAILTLTPRYVMISDMGLKNNPLALILPWVTGGQVMAIVLCRTFIQQTPRAVFESARLDGAGEFRIFLQFAAPLAKPILTTVAIMNLISFYNDYLWPLMVIGESRLQVATVAIESFMADSGNDGMGQSVAGFTLITLPLLILFTFTSRIYMEGLTSGALKA